ncbi:hypothetical protein ABW19_dt0200575 [Dactylella cylindrospora]|nr:hypothetical protein ABW19_dt0200575 [Dactylella cylindrospora]
MILNSHNFRHSSSSLVPAQEGQNQSNIPIQQYGNQQPPWGYSPSPNSQAQGQFWPQQQQTQQFGFPPQAPPGGQTVYVLQNGQLVPLYVPPQQGPLNAPPTLGSPPPGGNEYGYQYNQTAQSPASYGGASPYQVPPMPVPPTAPPASGSFPYQPSAHQPYPYSDSHLTASPISPVSEFSPSSAYSQSNSQTSSAPVDLSQNASTAAPKPMARKPVPGAGSSATPPPPTAATITEDIGSMSISEPLSTVEPSKPKVQLSPQIEQKVELLKNQGNSMVEAKNFDQAVMFYTMALDYNPESAVCLSNRSMAYTKLQPPKMKEAKEDADAATKADPSYWKGWSRLGDALLSMGEASQAVDAYNKAIQVGGTAVGQNTRHSLANAKRAVEQGKSKGPVPMSAATPLASASTRSTSSSYVPPKPAPTAPLSSPISSQPKSPTFASKPPPPATVVPPPAATISTAQSPSARSQPPPLSTQTPSTSTAAISSTAPTSIAGGNTPTSPSANAPARTNTQATSGLPAVLEEAVANVQETATGDAPPAYAPNPNSTDPTIRHMSQQAVYSQVIELRNTLLVRNKGSFVIKPYTAVGNIDAVRIEFVGMTTSELTTRELGVHPDQHPSFSGYYVNSLLYPGCTLIDLDMEVSKIGEGRFPGTYSVSGYSEVYRAQQLESAPILPITLSSVHPLPEITVDQIVSRMTVLRYNRLLPETNMQMYTKLREFLGPDPYPNQTDADKANLRNQITDICYVLNRVDSTKYVDMSNCRHLTNNTLGTAAQGIGLKNFLFQILLGCELLVRLLKEPPTSTYAGLISHNISANLVISDLWMQNIDTRRETTPAGLPRHLLISLVHQRQCEGLIRFAETLKWPYMDEARNYIEGAYNDLITGKAIGFDMCDWLFGLWNVPVFPARSNPENKIVTLKGIRLMLQQDQAITTTLTPLKIYRAAVDFDISGTAVSYTLYSNPTFVAAHPCVGNHLAHRTETKAIRKTIIPAVDLKDTYLQYNSLLVIDATLKGEEVLARAWCSERGCNAVIWRGDETCFACAALMTMSTNGLGFNVLIRSM